MSNTSQTLDTLAIGIEIGGTKTQVGIGSATRGLLLDGLRRSGESQCVLKMMRAP